MPSQVSDPRHLKIEMEKRSLNNKSFASKYIISFDGKCEIILRVVNFNFV